MKGCYFRVCTVLDQKQRRFPLQHTLFIKVIVDLVASSEYNSNNMTLLFIKRRIFKTATNPGIRYQEQKLINKILENFK